MLYSDESKTKFCQFYWALNLNYFGLLTQSPVYDPSNVTH